VSVRLLADYNRIHEVCCAVVSVLNGPATQFIGAHAPFGLGAIVSTPQHDNRDVAMDTDPRNRVKNGGVSGQIDWNLGHATLTSITAYRHSADRSFTDVDFTGADLANSDRRNSINTFTQEVRLASDGTGRFNYLIGGFYEHEHLNSGVDTTYGSQIRAYADALSGASTVPGFSNLGLLEYLQSLVTPSIVPGETYFQAGQGIHDFYTLKQDSYSIFGQADYKITDRLTVTGGVAYLNDRKKAASDVVLDDPFSSLNLRDVPQLDVLSSLGIPVTGSSFSPLSALQFFYANDPNHGPVNFPNANETGILKGHKVTYTAHAAYDLGIVNAYLTYSTGWKAGAYNLSSDGRPPDANGVGRTAAPENVTLYEAGLKAHFRGGFFNLAVFHQAIKGFQSNAYTGTGFSLVNAGKESVTGFEIDSAYQPISWLSLTGAVTYLHPKYNSFEMAPCVTYDTVRCPINPATGLTPNFRDLSGTRPATIPTWTASVAAVATHRFSEDLSGYVRGEFDYTSKAQLIETTPPDVSRYGNKEVDASISISSRRYQAEVMLWGRNLTNFYTLVTTFPTVAQTGSYSGIPNQPRTYGVTLRKSF
jgi:iron complex outermembrane receptor protein